jgi:lipopolysaccharide/colanic/teichoic acid biosynthesis glycosyltransferase
MKRLVEVVTEDSKCPAWVATGCPELRHCVNGVWDEAGYTRSFADVPTWKRILDISCILLALPVAAPLMALIALYIKLVSPGAVFFKQERVGLRGRTFDCLKFRSMRPNADTKVHQNHLRDLIATDRPMTKMDIMGDPRLIPLGALLRSSGLDELPQLINVLRGDMSLVGPRPCTPYEFQDYQPWQKERCNTLPGLTGLWQVTGKNKTTFTEMIQLDIFYTRNKSPLVDLRIMLSTFSALFHQVRDTVLTSQRPPLPVSAEQAANRS